MERKPDHIFDELLVMKCQENDQQAFTLLWKRWQPSVLRWSVDFTKDSEVAREIAQESWVSIYKGIGRLKDPTLFRFWAYKIVQRRSADWIRREQRKRKGIDEAGRDTPMSEAPEPLVAAQDLVGEMLLAIKQLPAEHQRILKLFYLEKMPIKALAQLMDLPLGTVKSRLYYAREQLRKKLKTK